MTGQTSLRPDRFEVDVLLVEAATGRAVWAETFERSPAAVRDHRAPQRGGEPGRAGAGAALRRDPVRPVPRCRRQGARDARQLRGGAALLCLLADLRPRDDRGGARRPRARRRGRARLRRGARLPVARLFQRLPLPPPDRRARPGPAATGRSRSPPARSNSRRTSSWARYALGLARWFAGDAAGALEALETGRTLNPNDTTILADLGQRYAMLARWDDAVPLLEESYASNPAQPGSYRIGLFLYHYAHGRFAEALAEARRVDAPQVLYGHVAVAAAAAELGLRRRGGGRRRRDPGPRPRLWRACRRRPREPPRRAGARVACRRRPREGRPSSARVRAENRAVETMCDEPVVGRAPRLRETQGLRGAWKSIACAEGTNQVICRRFRDPGLRFCIHAISSS